MALLPSLTARARTVPLPRRAVWAALGALLLASAALTLRPADAPHVPPRAALRAEGTDVVVALPLGWLATPIAVARTDDLVDVVAVRRGDAASVYPLAHEARVLALDERTVVLALDPDDAAQIALARANDLLIVPLLRAAR